MANLLRVGSRILKLVLDYEKMIFAGDSSSGAVAALKSREREYGRELLDQFLPMIEREKSKRPIQKLCVGELAPGMIIHEDILINDLKLLVNSGTEVSLPVYETLHNFSRTGFIKETVQVLVPEPI